MPSQNYSVLQIKPAKDSLTGQGAFIEFLASLKSSLKDSFFDRLFGTHDTITLEIVNLNQSTFFVVACPEKMEHLVRSQLAAQYPTALITPMTDYLSDWLSHGNQGCGQLVLTSPSHLPINFTEDDKLDQMASVVGGLSRTPAGQAAIVQICLFAAPKNWQKSVRSIMSPPVAEGEKASPNPQKSLIEKKLVSHAFSVDIRLAAVADNQSDANNLLTQMAASFGTYTQSEGNGFKLKVPKPASIPKLKQMIVDRSAKYSNQFQYLNLNEIAALFHLPSTNLSSIKGISWGKTLRGEAPINLPIDENIPESDKKLYNFFATTEHKNKLAVFGMKKGIDRLRHTYILGKSGTGKSTLIGRMAINDIQHGEGIAFVDPHGDTAEKLLEYVPKDRIDDVAYLDPSVKEKSFWMNPLYVKNPDLREMVASSIVSIFSKLYGNSWGPRLEYILRNTLLTLVYKPETTLADIARILTNKKYREEECLIHVTDPVLINFWRDEYDKYTEKFQTEAIAPILNKVGQFVTSPTIRDIINHPKSTVDFEEMMNTGKIIILNLPQGKIGEDNAALLGAMFISQIQIAAMNRANIAESERKDFFLYVDEFQNFATSSFVKILSEARKYRLGLILANQYIAQLPEEIQNAIFGNVGTVMSYVVGASDADRMAKELNGFYTQDDLVGLGKYQLAMKMSVESQMSLPFSAQALPLPETYTHLKDNVLEATYNKYYRKIEPMDMSQVTPPAPEKVAGKNDYRPQNSRNDNFNNRNSGTFYDRNQRQDRPQSKPYVPQLGPQYQGRLNNSDIKKNDPNLDMVTTYKDLSVPGTTSNINKPLDPIKEPTLEELDALRKNGFRPSVAGCFLNNKKILLVYQKTFNLWQLPQGGIENGQLLYEAFDKELSEEITESFVKKHQDLKLISVDKIEFPPNKHGLRDLKTDSGEEVLMKGKHYYFVATQTDETNIVIDATEFTDYKWLNFEESYKLIKETNTGGKLRVYTQLLHLLKNQGLVETTNKGNDEPKYQQQRPSTSAVFRQQSYSRPQGRPNPGRYNDQGDNRRPPRKPDNNPKV